jgi:ribosomal protein L40E
MPSTRKSRDDPEPWNRMAGGMTNDALSEIGIVKAVKKALTQGSSEPEQREVIKVRCRSCQALNEEQAKFCGQCGAAL